MPIRPQKCIKHPKFLTSRMLKLTGQSKCEKMISCVSGTFADLYGRVEDYLGVWETGTIFGTRRHSEESYSHFFRTRKKIKI